ncbi:MAG: S8 family peptidase [Elusimicrobiota bacterium]
MPIRGLAVAFAVVLSAAQSFAASPFDSGSTPDARPFLSSGQSDERTAREENGPRAALSEARLAQVPALQPAPSPLAPEAVGPNAMVRRIITFKKGTPLPRQLQLTQVGGGVVLAKLGLISALSIAVPQTSLLSFEKGLAAFPEVVRIENDRVQNWLKDVPAAPPAAGQKTPWGIERVRAAAAWPLTRGAGVKVAVIDTGIDPTHPDLRVLGGYSSITHDEKFADGHGHGTHVAGTIAALDDGKGVVGVAPEVALYGVQVLGADGSGSFATVIEGIQWAVEHKMDVANMSLGASEGTPALEEAVKAAAEAGLTIVAAAGNSGGEVGYPAVYPEVLAVSAIDSAGKLAYFSSRGPQVAFAAPGVSVESCYLGGAYETMDGTSMASPHVAGLAALAAAHGAHGPKALRAALEAAASPLPGLSKEEQGAGLVDAGRLTAPRS